MITLYSKRLFPAISSSRSTSGLYFQLTLWNNSDTAGIISAHNEFTRFPLTELRTQRLIRIIFIDKQCNINSQTAAIILKL